MIILMVYSFQHVHTIFTEIIKVATEVNRQVVIALCLKIEQSQS